MASRFPAFFRDWNLHFPQLHPVWMFTRGVLPQRFFSNMWVKDGFIFPILKKTSAQKSKMVQWGQNGEKNEIYKLKSSSSFSGTDSTKPLTKC